MDSLQEQVVTLTSKVDALHQVIDQVNAQVSEILANAKPYPADDSDLVSGEMVYSSSPASHYPISELAFEHKDILVDSTYMDLDRHCGESTLSPEVQIQRLTAQLTAAYNRIAALEEQLLAARVH